jgi:PTS system glucose-specific IIC component
VKPASPSFGSRTAAAKSETVFASLGGKHNVLSCQAVALTRLRVQLKDAAKFKSESLGAFAWQEIRPGLYHIIVGEDADFIAQSL